METFLRKIAACQSALVKAYSAGPPWTNQPQVLDNLSLAIKENFPDSNDIGNDLELIFRGHMDDLLDSFIASGESITESSKPFLLVKFSIDFALKYAEIAPVILQKMPYFLLEDMLECQTIEKAQSIWKIIESMVDQLTHPDLFAKGKFVVLKTCNSLLRKLSKSCNTEFSGRVLMFLAAVYPISERSAVNLPGKINSGNITYFEDAEEYEETIAAAAAAGSTTVAITTGGEESSKINSNDDENGSGDMQLSSSVAEAKRSSSNGRDRSGSNSSAVGDSSSDNNKETNVSHEDYAKFWEFQQFFASDSKVIESIDIWRKFYKQAKHVLSLFIKHSCSADELEQAKREFEDLRRKQLPKLIESQQWRKKQQQQQLEVRAEGAATKVAVEESVLSPTLSSGDMTTFSSHLDSSNNSSNSNSETASQYIGCKFLTSSQLFSLQLRDPQLRQQIAMQILYFLHYSKIKTFPFSDVAEAKEVLSDMVKLHNRCVQVIDKSPPNGSTDVLPALRTLLMREVQWIQWKAVACPAFDKPLPSLQAAVAATTTTTTEAAAAAADSTANAVGKKRKIDDISTEDATHESGSSIISNTASGMPPNKLSVFFTKFTSRVPKVAASSSISSSSSSSSSLGGEGHLFQQYKFDASLDNVKQHTKALAAQLPSLEAQLESYIEAEDPDAGIEDEYHPKHDHVYCWRTRRLMAQENLAAFESMYDGDIAKSFRKPGDEDEDGGESNQPVDDNDDNDDNEKGEGRNDENEQEEEEKDENDGNRNDDDDDDDGSGEQTGNDIDNDDANDSQHQEEKEEEEEEKDLPLSANKAVVTNKQATVTKANIAFARPAVGNGDGDGAMELSDALENGEISDE